MFQKDTSSFSNNNRSLILIYVVTILFIFLFTFFATVEDNAAILITGSVYVILGLIVSIYVNKQYLIQSVAIFFFFFLFYFLHMSFIHYGLNIFYLIDHKSVDEAWFFSASNDIIQYLKRGYGVSDIENIFIYHESPMYYYIIGKLAIFSNNFGYNSIFIQKMLIVFSASFIPVLLYAILLKFIDNKEAIVGTVLYGIFSYTTVFSTVMLRDIPVALTFMIVFYIILLNKVSIFRIILLLFTLYISYNLRTETGIFLAMMSSVYIMTLFNYYIKSNIIKLLLLSVLFLLLAFFIYKLGLIDNFLQIKSGYQAHSSAEANAGSLGVKLATLPFGLDYITMAFYSQIAPFPLFPFYLKFGFLAIFSILSTLFWYFTWGYLIYGIVKIKILNLIDVKLKYLFYFSIVYILLLSSTGTMTRRIMAVYPIVFLVAFLSFLKINKKTREMIVILMIFLYLVLSVLYGILKL